MEGSARDALAYQSRLARQMEAEAIEEMRAGGVEIERPALAPFVPAVRPSVWDGVAERIPDGEALISRLMEEARRTAGR